MEKLKNLLNPGKTTDDEIMYGSGTSSDPVHSGTGNTGTLSGEGSHLGSHTGDNTTTAGTTGTHTSTTSGTAGPHTSDLANKVDPRVDSDRDGSRTTGNPTGTTSSGYGSAGSSAMPGTFDDSPSNTSSGLGSNTTTGQPTTGSSTTGHSSHLGRDAGIGAAGVGLAEHEHRKHEGTSGYDSQRSNLSNPSSTTGTGLGSSNIATGSSGHDLGRDAALGAGATGLAGHEHNTHTGTSGYDDQRVDPANLQSHTGTGLGSSNTTDQGLTGNTTTGSSGHHLGRDAALGAGAAGLVGHEHNKHTGTGGYDSQRAELGHTGPTGTSTGYDNTGSTGTGFGSSATTGQGLPDRSVGSSGHHLGRDAAAVGGAAAVGEGVHHHHENDRDNLGSSGYSGTTPSGTGSSYHVGPSGTAISGPHTTITANRLDPHVNKSGASTEDAHIHDQVTGGGGETADADHGRTPASAALGALGSGGVDHAGNHPHSGHHFGRDAAGAGALGGAAYEAEKHHHDHAGHSSATTGTSGLASTSGTTGTTGTSGHHLGRDTAGAGALGGAAYEAEKHHHNHPEHSSTTGTSGLTGTSDTTGSSGHHLGRDAAGTGALGGAAYEAEKHHHNHPEHSSTTGTSGLTGTSDTTGSSGHHLGRDAAGAGALGGTAYEAEKHHHNHPGQSSTTGSSGYASTTGHGPTAGQTTHDNVTSGHGPAPNTTGPHSKDWMNKLDPTVNSKDIPTGSTGSRETTEHYGEDRAMRNRNAYVDPAARDNPGFVSRDEHPSGSHTGRDTAAGAGLAGAAYEAEKHHKHGQNINEPGYSSTTGPTGTTGTTGTTGSSHHYGRDAAGAGALGAAGYEAEKHHKHGQNVNEPSYGSTTGQSVPGYTSSTGPTSHTAQTTTTDPTRTSDKDHHYGRDAAGVGAVGAGAYEAEKHHDHNKDLKAAEKEHKHEVKEEKKEYKHEVKAAEKEHKHEIKEEKKEEKKHHGLLSFLHRDKSKKYSADEEAEFDRQEKEHNGRNAALGTAAAGGAAYEAEKHHGHHATGSDTNKPLPVAPGNHGIGTGEGTQNALVDRSRADYGSTPHGTEHHQKWEGGEGEDFAPPGSTLGDKLHGVARNRGVETTTTTGNEHNRLHKDPPSSHPAAQGGVTADGRHIEPGTGRVTDSTDTTGVHGTYPTSSTTNY